MSTTLKPPMCWPGGKRRLISKILPELPADYARYMEPFVGAGAVLVALLARAELRHHTVLIADAVRGVQQLWRWLYNPDGSWAQRDALDLLKHQSRAYNGLWRVNKASTLNVPLKPADLATPIDHTNLHKLHLALGQLYSLYVHPDYKDVLMRASAKDLVYLDPPYLGGFTAYTGRGWSKADFEEMARLAHEAHFRGAYVVLSHSDHTMVRESFAGCRYKHWRIVEVDVRRTMATRHKHGVRSARELIVCSPNYERRGHEALF
jgi:DNA adenine methylase